jgi:hypothetical protein
MVNYDTFNNVFTRTAVYGDANMDGAASDGDLNLVLTTLNDGISGKKWYHGNFTNHLDAFVDDGDLAIVLTGLNIRSGPIGNGAGSLQSSSNVVPEPSAALLVLAAFLAAVPFHRAFALAYRTRPRRESNRNALCPSALRTPHSGPRTPHSVLSTW